jgi:hypothetical protein
MTTNRVRVFVAFLRGCADYEMFENYRRSPGSRLLMNWSTGMGKSVEADTGRIPRPAVSGPLVRPAIECLKRRPAYQI